MATPNQVHPVSENPINVPVGTKMNTLSSKVVDNGRRIVSGALAGLALAVSSPVIAEESRSDGVVVAQAMTPNPEYDRIISEAKAAGKDPVDYLDEVGKTWTFAQRREARKYIADKATIARRAQEGDLIRANAEASRQLNITNIKLVNDFANMRKSGKFRDADLEYLKKIYNDKTSSDEVRKLIQEKFGDLFDFRILLAQA